jgi:hypothetical protein
VGEPVGNDDERQDSVAPYSRRRTAGVHSYARSRPSSHRELLDVFAAAAVALLRIVAGPGTEASSRRPFAVPGARRGVQPT